MRIRQNSLILGIILILVGLYMLADRLELHIFRSSQVYPLVFIIIGIAVSTRIRGRGHRDGVFATFFFLSVGLFFILRNYYLIPYVFNPWPIWLVAAGLGCLGVFLFVPTEWGMLIPATLLLFFGAGLLLREFDIFYLYDIRRYWPIALIAIGVAILLSGMRKQT